MKVTCQGPGCGIEFEGRSSAKYHADKCRKAARRKAAKVEAAEVEQPAAEKTKLGTLYDVTLRDLTKAGRVDTVYGQIALELAKDLKVASSKPAVAQKLMDVLAKALEDVAPSGPVVKTEEEELEDELEARRAERDAKKKRAQARRA